MKFDFKVKEIKPKDDRKRPADTVTTPSFKMEGQPNTDIPSSEFTQKWEYVYINYRPSRGNNYHDYEPVVVYLKPGEKKVVRMAAETKKELSKAKDLEYWTQVQDWIIMLGISGYEMVTVSGGITSNATGDYCGEMFRFWFKRPM